MPFETYPIPSPQPNPEAIEQRLLVQQAPLNFIAASIYDYLATSLQAQQASLGVLQRKLKAAMTRRTGAQAKQLQPIISGLADGVNTRLAEQRVVMGGLALQTGISRPVASVILPTATTPFIGDTAVGTVLSSPTSTPSPAPTGTSSAPTGTGSPSPSPVIAPPAPLPLPTLPTLPIGAIVQYNWVEGRCDDHSVRVAFGTVAPTVGTVGVDGWTTLGFEPQWTVADANAWLTANGASALAQYCQAPTILPPTEPTQLPPTEPPPAPPVPIDYPPQENLHPTVPPPACVFDWPMPNALPPPGSPEWCAAMPGVVQQIADSADYMYDAIDGILKGMFGTGEEYPLLTSRGPLDYFTPIANTVIAGINAVSRLGGQILAQVRGLIDCSKQWLEKAFSRCNVEALKTIMFLRDIVSAMRHIRIGTDALAWLTVDLSLAVDFIDQSLVYVQQYVCPQEAPSCPDAVEAWMRGYISEDLLECIYRLNGRDFQSHQPYIQAQTEKVSYRDAIQWVRRQGLGEASERGEMDKLGWKDTHQIAIAQELYWELPTIGDHLEWLRRNVDDASYVNDFSLMDGFDTEENIRQLPGMGAYSVRTNTHGRNFWAKFGGDLTALGMRKEYAALHYAAHWIVPSASQLFEFVWRLRPGRQPDGLTFTRDDLLRVMAEQDYAPYYRERLERISHPAPSLSLLRMEYLYRQIDDDGVVQGLMDLGYAEDVAKRMQRTLMYQVRRQRASMGKGYTEATLSRLLQYGSMSLDDYTVHMQELGYDDLEISNSARVAQDTFALTFRTRALRKVVNLSIKGMVDSYQCGAIDRQTFVAQMTGTGMAEEVAGAYADSIDSQVGVEICQARIKSVEKAVMVGRVSLAVGAQILTAAGMDSARVTQYTALWRVRLEMRPAVATAATLLRWVASGLMDAATASSRLTNLGWADPDLTVMLAEARGKLTRREAAQIAAQTKSAQAAAKARAKLAADAQKQARKLASDAKGQASQSTLRKWYIDGLITRQEYGDMLLLRGYDAADAERYVADADIAKNKPAKGAAKKAGGGAPPQPGVPGP